MKIKTFKVVYEHMLQRFSILIEAITKAEVREMTENINDIKIVAIEAIKGY